MILIGNKCDLQSPNRQDIQKNANTKAAEWNIPYIETSAKEGLNIDKAFNDIILQIEMLTLVNVTAKSTTESRKIKKKKCRIH
jgi:GTPase SAR1 family protein